MFGKDTFLAARYSSAENLTLQRAQNSEMHLKMKARASEKKAGKLLESRYVYVV